MTLLELHNILQPLLHSKKIKHNYLKKELFEKFKTISKKIILKIKSFC